MLAGGDWGDCLDSQASYTSNSDVKTNINSPENHYLDFLQHQRGFIPWWGTEVTAGKWKCCEPAADAGTGLPNPSGHQWQISPQPSKESDFEGCLWAFRPIGGSLYVTSAFGSPISGDLVQTRSRRDWNKLILASRQGVSGASPKCAATWPWTASISQTW